MCFAPCFFVFAEFHGHLSMSVHVFIRTLSAARIRHQFKPNQIKKGFLFRICICKVQRQIYISCAAGSKSSKDSNKKRSLSSTLVSAFLCNGFLPRQAPAAQQAWWKECVSFPVRSQNGQSSAQFVSWVHSQN